MMISHHLFLSHSLLKLKNRFNKTNLIKVQKKIQHLKLSKMFLTRKVIKNERNGTSRDQIKGQ